MNRQRAKMFPVVFSERRIVRCPKCLVGMSLTTVAGILVEKCPLCEGIFFDKGEVETLIQKNLRLERIKKFRLHRCS